MPRITAIVLVVPALLAACGGEPAASAACPETAPSPLPTPPYNDDAELAGRLPTEIGGQELEVQSVCVTTANPGGINLLPTFLEAAGVEISDVTMAVSQPSAISEDNPFVSISAFRYRGASEDAVRSAMTDTLAEAEVPNEDETIAEKEVTRVLGTVVWYVAGDTLYLITGEEPQVEEVLQALP